MSRHNFVDEVVWGARRCKKISASPTAAVWVAIVCRSGSSASECPSPAALDSHPLVLPTALLLMHPSPDVQRLTDPGSLRISLPLSLPLSLYIYISSPLSFLANYLVHRSGSPAAAYPLSMSSLACNIFMCLSQALCFQRQQPGARPPPWVRPPASQNFWRRLPSLTVCSRSIRRSGLVLAKMLSRTSWTLSRRNRLHKRRRQ